MRVLVVVGVNDVRVAIPDWLDDTEGASVPNRDTDELGEPLVDTEAATEAEIEALALVDSDTEADSGLDSVWVDLELETLGLTERETLLEAVVLGDNTNGLKLVETEALDDRDRDANGEATMLLLDVTLP